MTHHETASAFQAECGGELRTEKYASRIILRDANKCSEPTMEAGIFFGSNFYVTVQGADTELTKAIWRLVQESRAKGQVTTAAPAAGEAKHE